jgi:hypothetical protein
VAQLIEMIKHRILPSEMLDWKDNPPIASKIDLTKVDP